jgi:hypothetical protein
MAYVCKSSYWEDRDRKTEVQGWSWQNQSETLSEKLKSKRTVGVAKAVEHLPAWGPEINPQYFQKKKKKPYFIKLLIIYQIT